MGLGIWVWFLIDKPSVKKLDHVMKHAMYKVYVYTLIKKNNNKRCHIKTNTLFNVFHIEISNNKITSLVINIIIFKK